MIFISSVEETVEKASFPYHTGSKEEMTQDPNIAQF